MTNPTDFRPADWGRVALLLGGRAAEREISLKSGAQVLAAHDKRIQHVATVVDGDELEDFQRPRLGIDLHHRHFGVVGKAAEHGHPAALVGGLDSLAGAIVGALMMTY